MHTPEFRMSEGHAPEFDFDALVRSMKMSDIQSAINAATKKVEEERIEAERKRREAEAAAAAAKHKEQEHIQTTTDIANRLLSHTLTAQDVSYIMRDYTCNLPSAKTINPDIINNFLDADGVQTYIGTVLSVAQFVENPPSLFDFMTQESAPAPTPAPKSNDDILRSFINQIMK